MNERQTLLIAGTQLPDGLAVLEHLWEADLDVAAEVVTMNGLPQALRSLTPAVVIIANWGAEPIAPLRDMIAKVTPQADATLDVLLMQETSPADLPPSWYMVTPTTLVTWTRAWYNQHTALAK